MATQPPIRKLATIDGSAASIANFYIPNSCVFVFVTATKFFCGTFFVYNLKPFRALNNCLLPLDSGS